MLSGTSYGVGDFVCTGTPMAGNVNLSWLAKAFKYTLLLPSSNAAWDFVCPDTHMTDTFVSWDTY